MGSHTINLSFTETFAYVVISSHCSQWEACLWLSAVRIRCCQPAGTSGCRCLLLGTQPLLTQASSGSSRPAALGRPHCAQPHSSSFSQKLNPGTAAEWKMWYNHHDSFQQPQCKPYQHRALINISSTYFCAALFTSVDYICNLRRCWILQQSKSCERGFLHCWYEVGISTPLEQDPCACSQSTRSSKPQVSANIKISFWNLKMDFYEVQTTCVKSSHHIRKQNLILSSQQEEEVMFSLAVRSVSNTLIRKTTAG